MSKDDSSAGTDPSGRAGTTPEDAAAGNADPLAPPAGEEEIVLEEGKTLSDYLEEDEETVRTEGEEIPRPIPNVERMIVQPPGGLARARRAGGSEGETAPAEAQGAERAGSTSSAAPAKPGEPARSALRPSPPRSDAAPPVAEGEEDFGAMLESSLAAKTVEEGQTVQGVVVALGPEVAFLDIGGKSEATIDIGELKDDEGDIEVEVGETIEALVVSTEGGLKLSRKLARGTAARGQLGDAFRAGLPVEGRVEKSIKGGYEIRIAGQRAFCPISQIDLVRTADPAVHDGKVYTFRIIEYKEGGRNLVVSRRAILQEEEHRRAEEVRKAIVPGAVLTGRVVSVREYGAFVDLGGVQGLLHVSEMGWSRVSNPSEVVKPGDEITVKVLQYDAAKGRISLGLKQLQPDPWSKVAETYAIGQVREGRIVRVQDFGAFVELEPGVEGLAHVSTFPPTGTPDGWKKEVRAGTTGQFEILTVDTERKRIGVARLAEGASRRDAASGDGEPREIVHSGGDSRPRRETSPGASLRTGRDAIRPGARLTGKIERHESYGVFVFLAPGRTGLMPAAESGTQPGTDLKRAFPTGSEVEVAVLEADPSGKRIRVSRKALLEAEEKDDARAFAERNRPPESFGSIGDKLRAALAARRK